MMSNLGMFQWEKPYETTAQRIAQSKTNVGVNEEVD
jgi:hypothetical protein